MNRRSVEGNSAGLLRLFVAVHLPDRWLDALARAQEELRRQGLHLRFVRPEGIHLTLKFLGETDQRRLPEITRALASAVSGMRSFDVELGAPGTFGPRRRPRVVWYGITGDSAALVALHRAVEGALTPLGYAPEGRPFAPHLTLARVPDTLPPDEAERIAPTVARLATPQVDPLHVTSISLMRSQLGPGGARYSVVETWRLGGEADRRQAREDEAEKAATPDNP